MFKIQVNGVTVHEIDIDPQLVVGASIRTATGEASVAGFDLNDNFINLEIQYQLDTVLPVIEDRARLAKAEAVQSGDVQEKLYPNENARRLEALRALDESQAKRSAESDEDLSQQFAIEREAVTRDSSITAETIQNDGAVAVEPVTETETPVTETPVTEIETTVPAGFNTGTSEETKLENV